MTLLSVSLKAGNQSLMCKMHALHLEVKGHPYGHRQGKKKHLLTQRNHHQNLGIREMDLLVLTLHSFLVKCLNVLIFIL